MPSFTCPACGGRMELDGDEARCQVCGAILRLLSPGEQESSPAIPCPFCAASLPVGCPRCPRCGRPLGDGSSAALRELHRQHVLRQLQWMLPCAIGGALLIALAAPLHTLLQGALVMIHRSGHLACAFFFGFPGSIDYGSSTLSAAPEPVQAVLYVSAATTGLLLWLREGVRMRQCAAVAVLAYAVGLTTDLDLIFIFQSGLLLLLILAGLSLRRGLDLRLATPWWLRMSLLLAGLLLPLATARSFLAEPPSPLICDAIKTALLCPAPPSSVIALDAAACLLLPLIMLGWHFYRLLHRSNS